MLNGQNNYQTAPPGAGAGFPLVGSHGNMQGMQYGMGPGRPGPRLHGGKGEVGDRAGTGRATARRCLTTHRDGNR